MATKATVSGREGKLRARSVLAVREIKATDTDVVRRGLSLQMPVLRRRSTPGAEYMNTRTVKTKRNHSKLGGAIGATRWAAATKQLNAQNRIHFQVRSDALPRTAPPRCVFPRTVSHLPALYSNRPGGLPGQASGGSPPRRGYLRYRVALVY